MRVLATAVVRSSCGGTAIRYALPVLWMTSICTQWSDIGDANRAYTQKQVVRWQHGFDTAAFTKNWLTRGSTDPGAKSDVYDRVGVAGNVTSAFNSRVKRHGVNPHLSDKVDQ